MNRRLVTLVFVLALCVLPSGCLELSAAYCAEVNDGLRQLDDFISGMIQSELAGDPYPTGSWTAAMDAKNRLEEIQAVCHAQQ